MKKILLLFCIFMGVFSCRSSKTPQQHVEKAVIIQKDTLIVEKIRSVHDTIFVQVPVVETPKKECDTLCQKQLQAVLQKMAFHRKSADTKAGFYFDKYKNQLVLYQQLQEQLNTYKSNNQTITKEVEVVKSVPYTPKIILYMALFGGLCLVYFCYKWIRFFK